MAISFEKLRDFLGGHTPGQAQPSTPNPSRDVEQFRDQLLASALDVKEAWTNELRRGMEPSEIGDYYRARIDQINSSLADLRQLNPAITATIDVDQFQSAAFEEAGRNTTNQSRLSMHETRLQELAQERYDLAIQHGATYVVTPAVTFRDASHVDDQYYEVMREVDGRAWAVLEEAKKEGLPLNYTKHYGVRTLDIAREQSEQNAKTPESSAKQTVPENDFSQMSDRELDHLHTYFSAIEKSYAADKGSADGNPERLAAFTDKRTAVEAELSDRLVSGLRQQWDNEHSAIENPQVSGMTTSHLSTEILESTIAQQSDSIREEWQRDLESGHHTQHDLDTYFAGRIDQHNTLIEMAVEANPELQQTLPPPIVYQQLKDDLQQQIAHKDEQQATAQQQVSVNAFGVAV